jgi:hypothetical protein
VPTQRSWGDGAMPMVGDVMAQTSGRDTLSGCLLTIWMLYKTATASLFFIKTAISGGIILGF